MNISKIQVTINSLIQQTPTYYQMVISKYKKEDFSELFKQEEQFTNTKSFKITSFANDSVCVKDKPNTENQIVTINVYINLNEIKSNIQINKFIELCNKNNVSATLYVVLSGFNNGSKYCRNLYLNVLGLEYLESHPKNKSKKFSQISTNIINALK